MDMTALTFQVNVTVTDVNDNPPVFRDSNLKFSAVENTSVPLVLGKIVVTDKDSGDNGRVDVVEITVGNAGKKRR